ncbi:ISL3 family transposase [Pseudofulvimonas gallinarii]|uniref:ISL3 family transposase n=1 Tax=Pseudofulvimonas gallinarii TaxID=634155 RepID=UPI0010497A6B
MCGPSAAPGFLARFGHGQIPCKAASPARRISVPRLPTASAGQGRVRRSRGARRHPCSAGKKTICGACGSNQLGWYDRKTRRVRDLSCGDTRVWLDLEVRRVDCRRCGKVKTERLDFLADNPFYTKRFAWHIGRRCRQATISDVAKEFKLDWQTVKALDKQYMAEQVRRAGLPGPKVIGIDEISIRKGHTYRIVVSDLIRKRPIWFGGADRSEASMGQFYTALGTRKSAGIRLAVMDMWRPFRTATQAHAPKAAILFDKFHVMRHLGEALDAVRKSEYARLAGRDRAYIKGQKYTLLSSRENLSLDGRAALKRLLTANKRLNTAYLLKERFGQLWDYRSEAWARKYFDQWRASLRWQRLPSFEKFAAMIERHWDGIAAYCRPENKVSLGFVEGLNNKIRVIQRRAYGLRDEEYLRLKILTCMLPEL